MAKTVFLAPRSLAPPVRGRFCVEFLKKDGTIEEVIIVADNVDHILQYFKKHSITRYKLLISVRLVDVYYDSEIFGADHIGSCQLPFDIAAFCLQL